MVVRKQEICIVSTVITFLLSGYRSYLMHDTWLATNFSRLSLIGLILLTLAGIYFYIRYRRYQNKLNQFNPSKLSYEDISHNLKTPLNSIMGYSQLLLGDNTINDRQKEYINTISENSSRLLDHIKMLLNEQFEEAEEKKIPFIRNGDVEKILIVDDVKINRTFLRVMLERKGFTIVEAQNGREAIDMIKGDPPDLILMDIMMPVMDGLEAIEVIRASNECYSNIPVIAVTAKGKRDNMELILNAGFNAYLEKPFKEQDLISLIAS